MTIHGSPCFGCTQRNVQKFKKNVRNYTHTSNNQPTPTNCAKKLQNKEVGNKPYKLFKQTFQINYPKLCAHKNEATPTSKELQFSTMK